MIENVKPILKASKTQEQQKLPTYRNSKSGQCLESWRQGYPFLLERSCLDLHIPPRAFWGCRGVPNKTQGLEHG